MFWDEYKGPIIGCSTFALIIGFCIFSGIECNNNGSEFNRLMDDKVYSTKWELRQLGNIETIKGFSGGGAFFLGIGGFSVFSTSEIKLKFCFKNLCDQYELCIFPLKKVKFRLHGALEKPYVRILEHCVWNDARLCWSGAYKEYESIINDESFVWQDVFRKIEINIDERKLPYYIEAISVGK